MDENDILPQSLTLSKYAAARGKEIQLMKKVIATSTGTKMAFQKLPRHMRRRAMSHKVKRLPRRLREIHLNQMKKSGLPPKHKRPSRKYRRRHYNLLSEYSRRQKRVKWLDTHIWHAKRFHMVEKWGYKLADSPCDRAFRACYRATAKHCLVQDISYFKCVEISGKYEDIVENFKKISCPETGLTIGAKCYAMGQREGEVILFKPKDGTGSIKKAIGTVYFMWKPLQNIVNDKHVLWLWIHAAYYQEALDIILDCFQFKSVNMDNELTDIVIKYTNFNDIELKEIGSELNRFRLTGPLANAVLQHCFKVIAWEKEAEWVKKFDVKNFQKQNTFWETLKNASAPSELPPKMILSLLIHDPRLNFPKQRTKALPNLEKSGVFCDLPELYQSPIWDKEVRKFVKESKISNAGIAKMRSEFLVPGTELQLKGDFVPLVLVQRPGVSSSENNGYASGWDIIVPSGWAQPLWIALIMWGARAGGLREFDSIRFEMSKTDFLSPDTCAGLEEEKNVTKECKETFFKLPPNKRTNFNKLKIVSPFEWSWELLMKDWKNSEDEKSDFFVLRDTKMLKDIQQALNSKIKKTNIPNCPENCLLPVTVNLEQKGLCNKFSIICLPKPQDLKNIPFEPNCDDPLERERKEIRKNHKTLLKRLRNRRKRAKKCGKKIPIDKEMLKNYTRKMRELWLPEAKNIRHSCSREIMGFVKYGGFSFTIGQSKAVGYITGASLPFLLSLEIGNKVLVRSTSSRQYRLGKIDVICD